MLGEERRLFSSERRETINPCSRYGNGVSRECNFRVSYHGATLGTDQSFDDPFGPCTWNSRWRAIDTIDNIGGDMSKAVCDMEGTAMRSCENGDVRDIEASWAAGARTEEEPDREVMSGRQL